MVGFEFESLFVLAIHKIRSNMNDLSYIHLDLVLARFG